MAKHSAAERAIGTPATSKKTNAALNRAAKEGANGAARYALPADGSIPEFLLVKNRKKPTKAEQARIDAFMGRQSAEPERVDWRKPKGMSWEDWDAVQARRAEEKHARTQERVAELNEKYGRNAKRAIRALRPKKPRREELFAPSAIIRVLVEGNPCKEGSAAHAVFEMYRTGMTVAAFKKATAGACPGKLRPVDYLVYDSRKGRIAVEPAAAPKPAKKGGKKK